MKRALRNLIAFVFLGGIFSLIYNDLDNLWNASYMLSMVGLTLIFFVFWLCVPVLVVALRGAKRRRRNEADYAEWSKQHPSIGDATLHERGTLYIADGSGLEAVSVPGELGDVAFAGLRKSGWRKIQRVHSYLGGGKLRFAGKALELTFPVAEIRDLKVTNGGLVLAVADEGRTRRFAFTCRNPLIAARFLTEN